MSKRTDLSAGALNRSDHLKIELIEPSAGAALRVAADDCGKWSSRRAERGPRCSTAGVCAGNTTRSLQDAHLCMDSSSRL